MKKPTKISDKLNSSLAAYMGESEVYDYYNDFDKSVAVITKLLDLFNMGYKRDEKRFFVYGAVFKSKLKSHRVDLFELNKKPSRAVAMLCYKIIKEVEPRSH